MDPCPPFVEIAGERGVGMAELTFPLRGEVDRACREVPVPDSDVLASVLRKYLDSSRESLEALRDAIRANDPTVLQAIAHRLKSSSAQLGALAVAASCKELETMGHRNNLVDAERSFAQLQSDYLTACTVFRNEIAKEKQP